MSHVTDKSRGVALIKLFEKKYKPFQEEVTFLRLVDSIHKTAPSQQFCLEGYHPVAEVHFVNKLVLSLGQSNLLKAFYIEEILSFV